MKKKMTMAMTIHAIDWRLNLFPDPDPDPDPESGDEVVETGDEDTFWHCVESGAPQRLGFPLNASAEKPANEEGMLPSRELSARLRSSKGGCEKLGMAPEKLFP